MRTMIPGTYRDSWASRTIIIAWQCIRMDALSPMGTWVVELVDMQRVCGSGGQQVPVAEGELPLALPR